MPSIVFTQYLRPDGRTRQVTVERPLGIVVAADRITRLGFVFEIEMLDAETVSMSVGNGEEDLCGLVCSNGIEVPKQVDKLVRLAAKELRLHVSDEK